MSMTRSNIGMANNDTRGAALSKTSSDDPSISIPTTAKELVVAETQYKDSVKDYYTALRKQERAYKAYTELCKSYGLGNKVVPPPTLYDMSKNEMTIAAKPYWRSRPWSLTAMAL